VKALVKVSADENESANAEENVLANGVDHCSYAVEASDDGPAAEYAICVEGVVALGYANGVGRYSCTVEANGAECVIALEKASGFGRLHDPYRIGCVGRYHQSRINYSCNQPLLDHDEAHVEISPESGFLAYEASRDGLDRD
jgi:hypothetical protein